MSNEKLTHGPLEAPKKKGITTPPRLLALSALAVTGILAGHSFTEKHDSVSVPLTKEQRELADVLTYSNPKEKPTFQELPVIWSRDIAELSKSITSGEDGCFVFINRDNLAKSFIVRKGVVTKGVPPFTVKW